MSFISRCEEVPLAQFSTFGIGGIARRLFVATTVEDVQEAIVWAQEHNSNFIVIGKGSNCLFPDEPCNGLVILNTIETLYNKEEHWFAGGGCRFSLLGSKSAAQGFGGLEFAAGIPGTVGGSVYMNAGAHGQEVSSTIVSIDCVNEFGEKETVSREAASFGYRSSIFQSRRLVIVGVHFALYKDEEALEKQKLIIKQRKQSQPLHQKSCGCVFRNPIGNSAGRLIEECGLKGFSIGGAMVSPIHANFIVNTGSATASDVRSLIEYIQQKVYEKAGCMLQPEICQIGCF